MIIDHDDITVEEAIMALNREELKELIRNTRSLLFDLMKRDIELDERPETIH